MSEVAIAATRLGVVAAWADRPPDPNMPSFGTPEGTLHVQALEASGAPRGPAVELVWWSTPRIRLFPLDDGTFLLAYGECCSKRPRGAYLQHLDANATALGAPVALPHPDLEVSKLSSSGGLAAAVLTSGGGQTQTLLHIKTATEPMQLVAEELPDTGAVSLTLRPDGRVWLATDKPPAQLAVRLDAAPGEARGPSVDLPNVGDLSVAENGDLMILERYFADGPEVDAWQLHAGASAATARKIPRSEVLGSARLPLSSLGLSGENLNALKVARVAASGPWLTLAQERRPTWWSDSAWTGSSYLVIYVDAGQGQTRNVVVQSVTCGKKK